LPTERATLPPESINLRSLARHEPTDLAPVCWVPR
jgi:hypothetical protein